MHLIRAQDRTANFNVVFGFVKERVPADFFSSSKGTVTSSNTTAKKSNGSTPSPPKKAKTSSSGVAKASKTSKSKVSITFCLTFLVSLPFNHWLSLQSRTPAIEDALSEVEETVTQALDQDFAMGDAHSTTDPSVSSSFDANFCQNYLLLFSIPMYRLPVLPVTQIPKLLKSLKIAVTVLAMEWT